MNKDIENTSVYKEPGKPLASFILGCVGFIAWIIPLFGLPITITGLVFGIKACKREKNGLAIAGTILCVITLFLTILNSAWGVYLGITGQHTIVNKIIKKDK